MYLMYSIRVFLLLFCLVFSLSAQGFAQTVTGADVANRRAELQKQLDSIESAIALQETILRDQQNKSVSLERDIAILNAKIAKAKLNIQARDIAIQKLTSDIGTKKVVISKLSEKIEREKEAVAELIRKTAQIDDASLSEVLLSNQPISKFFEDADAFASINTALKQSFDDLEITKAETSAQKSALEDKRTEENQLRMIQILEKKKIEQDEAEKKKILSTSRGIEKNYQALLKETQKSAATIRSALFSLQGSSAISFEKALDYANIASAKTGVRPALILGIIAEESNLGQNVGTGSWRVDMKNPRDTVPFVDITSRLGLDPDKMPVSKKPWYGWGGAMGPAQFIPSTWILYEKKIATATGHAIPNPWDPYDAFMASAILMKENGAAVGTRAAERLAALRYLAGWTNANKREYAFYGDDVIDLADKYQKQIDILKGN
ncbi:hypothetical protein EPO17_03310 [Patescibacteria group bacterium]|nr:MAG: hypothetical protein EPO17_03310 [Patescibacteria group bacterium]